MACMLRCCLSSMLCPPASTCQHVDLICSRYVTLLQGRMLCTPACTYQHVDQICSLYAMLLLASSACPVCYAAACQSAVPSCISTSTAWSHLQSLPCGEVYTSLHMFPYRQPWRLLSPHHQMSKSAACMLCCCLKPLCGLCATLLPGKVLCSPARTHQYVDQICSLYAMLLQGKNTVPSCMHTSTC